MNITRRDLLKIIGGGAVGTVMTPIPWKFLRDSSVWSQNWPGVPVPKTGETTWRTTACSLCPAGCAVRARCIDGEPISLTGIPDDPVSKGALCSMGVAAHHLSFHPARIRSAMKRDNNGVFVRVGNDLAIDALVEKIRKGPAAIIDGQPGRALSHFYRQFVAALRSGMYLVPPSYNRSTAAVLRTMYQTDPGSLAPDISRAESLISFGTQLLDGWGGASVAAQLLVARRTHLTQIEPSFSRTAMHADMWVPITPGTEGSMALGLAHILLATGKAHPSFYKGDVREFVEFLVGFPPSRVAQMTGVREDTLRHIAAEMTSSTMAIGGGDPVGGPLPREDEIAINALNLILGNPGKQGGFIRRSESSSGITRDITEIPDHSVSVLIIDGSPAVEAIPWPVIAQKLTSDSMVVSFSPILAGHSLHAELLLPAAAPFESFAESVSDQNLPRSVLSISAPLRKMTSDVFDPVTVLSRVLAATGRPPVGGDPKTTDELIRNRAAEMFKQKRGKVFFASERKVVDMSTLATFEEFFGVLTSGGCWFDDDVSDSKPLPRHRIPVCAAWTSPRARGNGTFPLTLVATGSHESVLHTSSSPIMSKVYQESGLRQDETIVLMHPDTMSKYGVKSGGRATVRTSAGTMAVTVKADRRTAPGTILTAVATLNVVSGRPTWRIADAALVEDSVS